MSEAEVRTSDVWVQPAQLLSSTGIPNPSACSEVTCAPPRIQAAMAEMELSILSRHCLGERRFGTREVHDLRRSTPGNWAAMKNGAARTWRFTTSDARIPDMTLIAGQTTAVIRPTLQVVDIANGVAINCGRDGHTYGSAA